MRQYSIKADFVCWQFFRPLLVVAELAVGDNINAFVIESFFGN